jgi:hypothetical protein
MKSGLEVSFYKRLKKTDLKFSYEPERIILVDGSKINGIEVLAPKHLGRGRYGKTLEVQTRALLKTTYTPDFLILKNNYRIYVDVKGMPNDVYPLKKKLFLLYLMRQKQLHGDTEYLFIEPHTTRQMDEAIDYINSIS